MELEEEETGEMDGWMDRGWRMENGGGRCSDLCTHLTSCVWVGIQVPPATK
jgi:hypothetical protein